MAKSDSILAAMPDFSREAEAYAAGARYVAGIDEAGRGPLAGPVVAAAVVLDRTRIPDGLNDSKKLTADRREALFEELCATAHVALCAAPPTLIDTLNIRGATLWAMCRALDSLPVKADLALVDGRDIPPQLACQGQYVIGGDALSVSIAAASIIAKVARDRMCRVIDCGHPAYGFASHKGYSTPIHLDALVTHGPTDHHRMSFAPVLAAATR